MWGRQPVINISSLVHCFLSQKLPAINVNCIIVNLFLFCFLTIFNFAFSADENSQESEAAAPFFIDVEANAITYRIGKSRLNFILKQIEMHPASCRGMRWDPSSELHFTLQAKSEFHAENDMSGIFSHLMELEKSSEGDIITVIEQCPSSCCCSGCGQPVFSQNRYDFLSHHTKKRKKSSYPVMQIL